MREIKVQSVLLTVLTVLATLIEVVDGPLWARLTAVGVIVAVAVWALHLERRFRVLRHVSDVIPDYNQDGAIFAGINSEFAYLGVSGATIYQAFADAAKARHGHKARLTARLLLICPHTDFVLTNQKIVNPDAGQADADLESDLIEFTARRFLNLHTPGLGIEVRFYRASLHHWTYLIDHGEAVVGVRLIGSEGLRPPALLLRHGTGGHNPLLKLFREEFETLWIAEDTVSANDYFAAKSTKGTAGGAKGTP